MICETLVTDNGPQFSGADFADFAESYGFRHVTSSPKYPQGNAEAEHAVQTVKGLLKKSDAPYLALLSYRSTPLQNGYSPVQILMGRRLRPTVPILPALLEPAFPDGDMVLLKEKERCTTLQSATPRMETQQTHSWAGRVGHRPKSSWSCHQKSHHTWFVSGGGTPRDHQAKPLPSHRHTVFT